MQNKKIFKLISKTLFSVTIVLLVFSCFFFVGCKQNKDNNDTNKVVGIEPDMDFVSQTFYQGDVVDFSQYDVTINYVNGSKLELKMNDPNITISGFSTQTVGNFVCTISYQEISVKFYYAVLEVVPAGLFYNGKALILYGKENNDFSNVYLDVIYNNGNQTKVYLSSINDINFDLSLTNQTRELSVSYAGLTAKIPYTVTNREIKKFEIYNFTDNTGYFSENCRFIMQTENNFILYKNTDGEIVLSINKKPKDFNIYESSMIYNREQVFFILTLINNSVVADIKNV